MATVIGLFETRDGAFRAIEALRAAGFRDEDLGIALRDGDDAGIDVAAARAGEGDATAEGAAIGGLLGGLTGVLAAAGILAIPGVGPVLLSGPLAATLAGIGVGAATGGLVGALGGLGIPEDEAQVYQDRLSRGDVLFTARVDVDRAVEARAVLIAHGLRDIDEVRRLGDTSPDRAAISEPEIDRAVVDEKASGVLLGGTTGALAGGLVAGPVGAGIGAVVGSMVGGVAAAFDDLDYRQVEPEFRLDWERGPYRESSAWDEASAAYQHGWDRFDRPAYRGRSWDDAAPDLRAEWTGPGTWEEYAPMVRDAWERRAARARPEA